MTEETDDQVRERLLRLHGRMSALSDAMSILGEESAKVASFQAAPDDAPPLERLASAEGLAAASLEAVRACAARINAMFTEANAEFEQIKTRLGPGRSFSTH